MAVFRVTSFVKREIKHAEHKGVELPHTKTLSMSILLNNKAWMLGFAQQNTRLDGGPLCYGFDHACDFERSPSTVSSMFTSCQYIYCVH